MLIYAIDDEPILLKTLNKAILDAVPDAKRCSFSRATALLDALATADSLPDVAFLDIELPGMGGMELARQMKLQSPNTWIVFVTGYSQYAIEAYEMHARGYIMKPVTAERIRAELEAPCAVPLKRIQSLELHVKCFGDFEVYANEEPLKFERSKTKELLAYLIDRNGAAVNTATLCAVLWEGKEDNETQRNYFRKLVADLSRTLKAVGTEDVFLKSRNSFAVDVEKIDCDYFRFLLNDPSAVNAYSGEYMKQYSWAEQTIGVLEKPQPAPIRGVCASHPVEGVS